MSVKYLYKFFSNNCGPCATLAETMKSVDTSNVVVLDCNINSDAGFDLARKYKVRSVPTLVIDDGVNVSIMSGLKTKQEIEMFIGSDS